MIKNIEKYTINPEFAVKFSGCEVYRILRYKIKDFPEGYSTLDWTGELRVSGDKAIKNFFETNNSLIYVGSYQAHELEKDGNYYTPSSEPSLKIPTGTLYCYEVIAVK